MKRADREVVRVFRALPCWRWMRGVGYVAWWEVYVAELKDDRSPLPRDLVRWPEAGTRYRSKDEAIAAIHDANTGKIYRIEAEG